MKLKNLITLLFLYILLLLLACNENQLQKQENKSDLVYQKSDTVLSRPISLDYGFTIEGEDIETFKKYGVFTKLLIKRNDSLLYKFDNIDEFEINNLPCYVFKIENKEAYQVLFRGNSKPSKDWFNMLYIENDSVISITQIPFFEDKPKNLDNDENLELAGYWDYPQVWGENDELTSYNPILFYEITKFGLILDSALTEEVNTRIYGEFYGYQFSEEKEQEVQSLKKHAAEIERIKSKKI